MLLAGHLYLHYFMLKIKSRHRSMRDDLRQNSFEPIKKKRHRREKDFGLTLVSDRLVSSWSFKTELISTRGSVLSKTPLMEVFSV